MPETQRIAEVGPIGISHNGRYFTQSDGKPFFWLGDTQWELSRVFPLADVRAILEDRKSKGLSVVQVMLTGVGDGSSANLAGHAPWVNGDPRTPNERYFAHVDAVVQIAREMGLVLVVGVFHQLQESRITEANAHAYAAWIAHRYRDAPNLIWTMYPKAEPQFVPLIRELAVGLREGDGGGHLINVHPDPSPASSSFIHEEPWLSFNSIQTWAYTDMIGPMVAHDYHLTPARPVVMAEGAYEAGPEYGFSVTPLWVRRQAYWTYLAGGHHCYGHNDAWRLPPTWREALDAPGARQLAILKEVLTGLDGWWDLVPERSVIAACEDGDPALNAAACSADGKWCLVYFGGPGAVSIRMDSVGARGTANVSWIDPATGEREPVGDSQSAGVRGFATPAGWEDALLLLAAHGC